MAKTKVRAKKKIPTDESKADRFVRVVTPRVAKAVKAIRTIGFCAGSTYEYTPNQVNQILKALDTAFQTLRKQYTEKTGGETEFGFQD